MAGQVRLPVHPPLRAGRAGGWPRRSQESRPRRSLVPVRSEAVRALPGVPGAAPECGSPGGVGARFRLCRLGSRPGVMSPLPGEYAWGRSPVPLPWRS